MKHTFKIIIFMLALLVYVSILACGGGGSDGGSGGGDGGSGITFSTSDLEGAWSHLYKGSTVYGSLTMGTDGTITPGGSYNEIGVSDKTYTDGALLITNSGTVSGSLTTSDTSIHNIPISGGQMSRDKGLMTIADTKPGAEMGLFMKPAGSYSQSVDLAGQWSYGSQNEYGDFTLSSVGAVTSGDTYQVGGGTPGIATGTLTININTGEISGTVNNFTVVSGWMSPDKKIIFLAFAEDNAYIAVKMDAKFDEEALGTDTYKFVSFSDTPPKVAYGTITMTSDINGTSTVNGGTWTQIGVPPPNSGTYDSGPITIGTDGVISPGGTLKARHSDGTTTTDFKILSGQVSSNRNFSINISQEVGGVAASQITLLVRTP